MSWVPYCLFGVVVKYSHYYQSNVHDKFFVSFALEVVNIWFSWLVVSKINELFYHYHYTGKQKLFHGNVLVCFLGVPIFDVLYLDELRRNVGKYPKVKVVKTRWLNIFNSIFSFNSNMSLWVAHLLYAYYYTRSNSLFTLILMTIKNFGWFIFFYEISTNGQ